MTNRVAESVIIQTVIIINKGGVDVIIGAFRRDVFWSSQSGHISYSLKAGEPMATPSTLITAVFLSLHSYGSLRFHVSLRRTKKMFELINFIVKKGIAEHKELVALYALTPEGLRKSAEARDGQYKKA